MLLTVCTIILCIFIAAFFFATRLGKPPIGMLSTANNEDKALAGNSISVSTWNIGFGALGAKADLFVDGGKNMRALSKAEIVVAVDAIAEKLAELNSDAIFIQENAHAGFLNRRVKLYEKLIDKLPLYSNVFWADLKTSYAPLPFDINHGMSVFSSYFSSGSDVLEFPQDPLYYYGFLKKYYGGIIQRLPIAGTDRHWVMINIHLSAFDEGASVRKQQLDVLFAYAEEECTKGNSVVIGGDWNMRLVKTSFPHKTPKTAQSWVFDFPQEKLPKGWLLAVDGAVPTVRTLHQPYVKGDNYTSVIDGFVVSPNVKIDNVVTHNLNFEHTDHHPVTAQFSVII